MNRSLRKAVVLVAVVSAATVATAVRPPVAQAAPVVIAGCAGDTAAVRVTVDDGLLAGGAIVPIHDNTAGVTYPAPTDKAMSSPVCGAQRLADGSLRREWLYCTDPVLNTCATAPLVRKGDSATGIARLTAVDRARLAWVLDTEIHNDTQTTRVRGQRLVWCVTEHRAAGAPAPNYYNDGVNDQPLACPAWGAVDPALKMTVSLALTGPSAPVAVAQPAQFVLTTDASPITLTSTGISTFHHTSPTRITRNINHWSKCPIYSY